MTTYIKNLETGGNAKENEMKIFVQLIPILSLATWGIAYQVKARKTILGLQMIACLLLVVHFVLLGKASAGIFFSAMAAARLLLFSLKKKGNWISNPATLAVILLLQITYTVVTIEKITDAFALLGITFAVLASWQDDPRRLRILFVPCHIFWVAYDLSVGSYGGALTEGILGLSTLVSLLRKGLK